MISYQINNTNLINKDIVGVVTTGREVSRFMTNGNNNQSKSGSQNKGSKGGRAGGAKRGFAAMPRSRVRESAAEGGRQSHGGGRRKIV